MKAAGGIRETYAESRPSINIRTSVCLENRPEIFVNNDENDTPCRGGTRRRGRRALNQQAGTRSATSLLARGGHVVRLAHHDCEGSTGQCLASKAVRSVTRASGSYEGRSRGEPAATSSTRSAFDVYVYVTAEANELAKDR